MEGDKEIEMEEGRFSAIGYILFFYAVPVIALTTYTWWARDGWMIWVAGLFLTSLGTYFFANLMHQWAHQIPQTIHQPESQPSQPIQAVEPPQEHNEKVAELEQRVQAYAQMVEDWKNQATTHEEVAAQAAKEQEEVQGRLDLLTLEYEQYKLEAQHLIEEERNQIEAQHQTLVSQKNELDDNQQQIIHLETKVRDLNYEIKTLLQLAEKEGKRVAVESEVKRSDSLHLRDEALW